MSIHIHNIYIYIYIYIIIYIYIYIFILHTCSTTHTHIYNPKHVSKQILLLNKSCFEPCVFLFIFSLAKTYFRAREGAAGRGHFWVLSTGRWAMLNCKIQCFCHGRRSRLDDTHTWLTLHVKTLGFCSYCILCHWTPLLLLFIACYAIGLHFVECLPAPFPQWLAMARDRLKTFSRPRN